MKKVAVGLIAAIVVFVVVMQIMIKAMPYFTPSRYANGNLFFANAEKLSSIVVKSEGPKIKLRKLDGSWYCNGYYAQNALLDNYIEKLSQATIVEAYQGKYSEQAEYEFDISEQQKFYFSIAPSDKNDQSIVNVDGKNYEIDTNIMLPTDLSEYYVQPLLPLADRKIEQQVGITGDLDIFYSMRYFGATQKLSDTGADISYKSFALISNDGIKFVCGLYKGKDQYWVTVNLKTTIMPTIEADKYVKENGFRYEGWYFAISSEDGNRLWNLLTNK